MNSKKLKKKITTELEKIAFTDFSTVTKALSAGESAELISKIADLEQYFPAISQVKYVKDGVEIKFYDKLKAIELLSKYVYRQEEATESDFDNLISVISSRAAEIWKGGDKD